MVEWRYTWDEESALWYNIQYATTAQEARTQFLAGRKLGKAEYQVTDILIPAFVGDGTDYVE